MQSEILHELQIKAERQIGKMDLVRGSIPSKELLYKFYHFYWDEDYYGDMDINNDRNICLKMICSNMRNHVIKLANLHYSMSFQDFNLHFHEWNKINNPIEYEQYPAPLTEIETIGEVNAPVIEQHDIEKILKFINGKTSANKKKKKKKK
jgi:hypothetical protein